MRHVAGHYATSLVLDLNNCAQVIASDARCILLTPLPRAEGEHGGDRPLLAAGGTGQSRNTPGSNECLTRLARGQTVSPLNAVRVQSLGWNLCCGSQSLR